MSFANDIHHANKTEEVTAWTLSVQTVGRTLGAIGQAANVIVDTKNGNPVFASAHDLRRSFGTRWSSKVMPAVLQELMRHAAIETTLRYYVDGNADKTAAEVWKMFHVGSVLGSPNKKGSQRFTETP